MLPMFTWAGIAAILHLASAFLTESARVGDKAKVLYAEGCKITTAPQGFPRLVGG